MIEEIGSRGLVKVVDIMTSYERWTLIFRYEMCFSLREDFNVMHDTIG